MREYVSRIEWRIGIDSRERVAAMKRTQDKYLYSMCADIMESGKRYMVRRYEKEEHADGIGIREMRLFVSEGT